MGYETKGISIPFFELTCPFLSLKYENKKSGGFEFKTEKEYNTVTVELNLGVDKVCFIYFLIFLLFLFLPIQDVHIQFYHDQTKKEKMCS